MHPGLKRLMLSLPIALAAAAAGYFLFPWLGLAQLSPPTLFATGIALGVIIGALTTITIRTSAAAKSSIKAARQSTGPVRAASDDSNERKTVFIGNLAYRASPRQLREMFEVYGTVHSVRIATDRETRKPRGFGFIEMNETGATQAIQALHGSQLYNRELNLSEAKQRESGY